MKTTLPLALLPLLLSSTAMADIVVDEIEFSPSEDFSVEVSGDIVTVEYATTATGDDLLRYDVSAELDTAAEWSVPGGSAARIYAVTANGSPTVIGTFVVDARAAVGVDDGIVVVSNDADEVLLTIRSEDMTLGINQLPSDICYCLD